MENSKGCSTLLIPIIAIIITIFIGNILFKAVNAIGDYIAIILAVLAGAALLGFIIMIFNGMREK